MYYRRKIILALLQIFEGKLSKLDFQKLLFLYSQKQINPSFYFLPYRFGCYSAQANQDLKTMIKYKLVKEDDKNWMIQTNENYIKTLNENDEGFLEEIHFEFKNLKGNNLIRYVYREFPFYAIHSEMAEKLLNNYEFKKINSLKPTDNDSVLFTIGYEGKTIEQYAMQLIQNNIKLLCDVRMNPLSMKFGFSKNQLKNILSKVGIEYLHLPGLGVDSSKRKNLISQSDYEKLFMEYEIEILPKKKNDLKSLAEVCLEKKRVALTCFEKDHLFCHRSRTANALLPLLSNKFSLEHI